MTVALRGADEEVEARFKGAAGLFREIAVPFSMAVTLLEYGEWLGDQDRAADAGPLLTEARTVFEGLKARPWIERVDRAHTMSPI